MPTSGDYIKFPDYVKEYSAGIHAPFFSRPVNFTARCGNPTRRAELAHRMLLFHFALGAGDLIHLDLSTQVPKPFKQPQKQREDYYRPYCDTPKFVCAIRLREIWLSGTEEDNGVDQYKGASTDQQKRSQIDSRRD